MRRAVPILAMALAFSLVAEAVLAAVSGGLTLEVSRSRRLVLPGVASTVSIADPAIVDVAILDSHSIVVVGKAFGVTDIVITDHSGRLLMNSRVSVVPMDTQRLTVIRGPAAADYVCVSRCSPAVSGATSSATTQTPGQPASETETPAVTTPQVNAAPAAPRSPP
ncbi:MAG TPA: pilus assembly protein N-terminal domain-containing protein [Caulobacteraceae bacterium]|nr:pilus assembly protein N-terminal domain-containing protein [Caulobacteraceae bacterium]